MSNTTDITNMRDELFDAMFCDADDLNDLDLAKFSPKELRMITKAHGIEAPEYWYTMHKRLRDGDDEKPSRSSIDWEGRILDRQDYEENGPL